MSRQYYDPAQASWANAMNNASNAFGQYLQSKGQMARQEPMMEKYRTDAALNQAQLDAPTNLNNIFKQIFSPQQEAPSPDFVGPMQRYEAGKIPQEVVNKRFNENYPDLFTNAMRFAGDKPGNLGDIFMAFAANAGASPEQLTRAQMGAGMAYGNTKEGFDAKQNEPFTLSPGSIRYSSDGKPLVSAPFKPGGGASFRVLPDGTVEYGEDGLGQYTNAVKTDLQKKDIALDEYKVVTQNYRDAILKNPGAVGTRGNLARYADMGLGQVEQFAPNSKVGNYLSGARDNLAGQYVDPKTGETMNKDLYSASSLSNIVPFATGAIVGQSGKSLSDKDAERLQNVIGSADDWTATPDKLIQKLNEVDKIVNELRPIYQGRGIGNQSSRASNRGMKPGVVDNGYRYLGGDPNDQNNWEQVQ